MRYLFIVIILLISNQSFAEWKYVNGSLVDDKKITKRTYIDKVKAVVDGKTKTIKYKMVRENKSWHITKNYKNNKNCEPFNKATYYHKNNILNILYWVSECTPCVEKKGLCGRPLIMSGFKTMKEIEYFQNSNKSLYEWVKSLENNKMQLVTRDEYGSVVINLFLPFGNREHLYIFTALVKDQNQTYPYYESRVIKYNTKNRDLITKISNESNIFDERIINEIDTVILKIQNVLKDPKEISLTDEEIKTIFESHVSASYTKYQTRD